MPCPVEFQTWLTENVTLLEICNRVHHIYINIGQVRRGGSSSSFCICLAKRGWQFWSQIFTWFVNFWIREARQADSGADEAEPGYCVKDHKIVFLIVLHHVCTFNYSRRELGGQSPSWFFGQISTRYFNIWSCWTIEGSDSRSR